MNPGVFNAGVFNAVFLWYSNKPHNNFQIICRALMAECLAFRAIPLME
ncbi:hypothetical protein LX99_04005 [Mucilaginibacter oryzae]|uniref:Uncharacterized protein n=1 Tax=Mucilaginibacter oryzae TaxID=468058 RepID=A0A316H5K4_9SPHI|nr:hypothetical protein LX99_04005 [Mucilaginibacter oryzae]